MMKNLPKKYHLYISEFKNLSRHVNGMIEDGSFYQLPFKERFILIFKLKRLYLQLQF